MLVRPGRLIASSLVKSQKAGAAIRKPTSVSSAITAGGAAVPQSLIEAFEERFGVTIIQGWGMTETISHGIIGDALLPNPPNTTGRPAAGYGIRILRADRTHVEPGETGHLECRGRRGIELFLEYLNAPEATAASFTDDGWFITGDRVTLGTEGTITFSDRDKDMLKIGGENVDPMEVEAYLMSHPAIDLAAVVSYPDARLSEVAVAFVRCRPAAALTEADVIAHCRGRIASFKIPRHVHFVDEFPMTSSGKIQKVRLREEALRRHPPVAVQ